MVLLRILVNGLVMALEFALILGAAVLGYRYPLIFAALTTTLAFVIGLRLEFARLKHELPFYFDGPAPVAGAVTRLVAVGEAALKAAMAGLVALLMFSGTDQNRLFWEAVIFGFCVWAGSSLISTLAIRFNMRPSRWGYFRLAAPFGLLFSLGITALVALSLLKAPGVVDVLQKAILETASKPTLGQASELLFLVKMWFDGVIVTLLSLLIGPALAPLVGTLLSVNVLSGFVVAIYAVVVAEVGLGAERMLSPK